MGRQVTGVQHSPADDEAAIEAARRILDLREHPGWQTLTEALDQREREIQQGLLYGKAQDSAAGYATEIGYMRGLRETVVVAERVVARGRAAAAERRERENTPAEEAA